MNDQREKRVMALLRRSGQIEAAIQKLTEEYQFINGELRKIAMQMASEDAVPAPQQATTTAESDRE